MTALEVLVEARALLARRGGWGQFAFRGRQHCAGTAIQHAGEGQQPYVVGEALRALNRIIGDDDNIVDWNDAPGRTKRQVLAAFDKAIAAERAA